MTTNLLDKYGITVFRGIQLDQIFGVTTGAIKSWGWVKLEDLAKALKMDPIDLLGEFDVLSKDYSDPNNEQTIQLSYINSDGIFRQCREFAEWNRVDMVPAGWALDVLKAFEAGVDHFDVYTTDRVLDWDEEDPDNNCWKSPYDQFGAGWVLVFAFDAENNPVARK